MGVRGIILLKEMNIGFVNDKLVVWRKDDEVSDALDS